MERWHLHSRLGPWLRGRGATLLVIALLVALLAVVLLHAFAQP